MNLGAGYVDLAGSVSSMRRRRRCRSAASRARRSRRSDYAYSEFEAAIHEFEDEFAPGVSGNGDVSEEPLPVG